MGGSYGPVRRIHPGAHPGKPHEFPEGFHRHEPDARRLQSGARLPHGRRPPPARLPRTQAQLSGSHRDRRARGALHRPGDDLICLLHPTHELCTTHHRCVHHVELWSVRLRHAGGGANPFGPGAGPMGGGPGGFRVDLSEHLRAFGRRGAQGAAPPESGRGDSSGRSAGGFSDEDLRRLEDEPGPLRRPPQD